MDVTSIAFLVVFVVLGGVIAIFADELGRRIGKRRLVLHRRIRPRTTARIITFFSGMSITILTIVLLYALSSDVRIWLQEGRRAIAKRDQLQADVNRLTKVQSGLKNDNATLLTDNKNLENTQTQLKDQVGNLSAQLAALQKKNQQSQALVASTQRRVASLDLQVASVNRSLHDATAKRDFTESQRRLAVVQRDKAKADFARLTKEYADLEKRDLDLDNRRRDSERLLASTQADLDAKTQQTKELDTQIQTLTNSKSQLEAQVSDARQSLADAQRQLGTLTQMAENFASRFRDKPVMFRAGDEIARFPLPSGISKNRSRSAIESAIVDARNKAKERGASRAGNIDYADLIDLPTDNGQVVSVEAQKDLLASELAGSPNEQVLIVFSAFNSFAGEGVVLGFAHLANPVVYQAGQTLAQIRVDGRQDRAHIIQSLNGLGPLIHSQALKDHMIPTQRGDLSLGSVTPEDILDMYDQIRASRGSVKVLARAKYLTRAGDPLVLDFRVQ